LGKVIRSKYNPGNIIRMCVHSLPEGVSPDLIAAYLSTNSWKRFNSALKCHCLLIYPLAFFERLYRLGFVGINVYLSDLKLAHKLRDLDSNQFKDFFLK
jgi:hypothetical protein